MFVQSDNVAGNQVVAYDRAANGTLSQAGVYATGGLGGALGESVVDHLASQGSLTADPANGLLYAVNAGSNSISVFAVYGDKLALRQVIGSGGAFPVSIAVDHGLVYVLNAEEGGSVQGYTVAGGQLARTAGIEPAARAEPDRNAAVHAHAGTGHVLAGRLEADRHDEGERQRHRRLPRRLRRSALADAGRQLRARRGAVRGQLRPDW